MSSPRRPFEAKGILPEWRLIYDQLLAEADFGAVISYERLDAVLGRTFKDYRSPIYRAMRHLLETRKRWLVAVPLLGYRVIEPNEHVLAAKDRKQRAKRQLGTMVEITNGTDLDYLKPAELQRWHETAKHFANLYAAVTHIDSRIRRIEEVLHIQGKLPPTQT